MASGPSFLFKARQTFVTLLNTPLLPPPEGPPIVEMTPMDAHLSMPPGRSPRSSSSGSSSYSVYTVSPTDSPSASHFSSLKSSIELDPSQAECVREMIADATH